MLGEGAGDGRTVLLWMLVLVQRRLLGAGGCGHRVFGDSPVPVAAGDLHLLGLVPAAHSVSCRWPPNVLYLLRVLFCSWSPPPPPSFCSLLQRWLETPKWSRMALGAGAGHAGGVWEQQGHPSQSIFDDGSGGLLGNVHHHPCPCPSILVLTWCHHGLNASGQRLKSVPIPFPAAFGSGMDPAGPEITSHGEGDGSGAASPG